jgi:hypothetical protein
MPGLEVMGWGSVPADSPWKYGQPPDCECGGGWCDRGADGSAAGECIT